MNFAEIKNLVNTSTDYDFLRTDLRLKGNIILLGLGGSYAYGTNTDTSDIDIRGIANNNPDDLLRTQIKGPKFEQFDDGNTDTVIYSFNKMVRLLLECNPNTIEILGNPLNEYLYVSDVGKELLTLAPSFLSKRCERTFEGYATQQLYRLKQKSLYAMSDEEYNAHIAKVLNSMIDRLVKTEVIKKDNVKAFVGEDKNLYLDAHFDSIPAEKVSRVLNELNTTINEYNKNSKRNKNALEHGKINKHAMHLLRLYMMGIDILKNQAIVTKRVKEHDLLMSIRNGAFSGEDGTPNKEFFDLVDKYRDDFQTALKHSALPDEPDYEKVFKFTDRVNTELIMNKNIIIP